MKKLFKRIFRVFDYEPDWWCVESMKGHEFGVVDDLIIAAWENHELPRVGDLIIKLDSCSMGTSVRRDTRWRVMQIQHPYKTSFLAFNQDGETKISHIRHLRRHRKIDRVWISQD